MAADERKKSRAKTKARKVIIGMENLNLEVTLKHGKPELPPKHDEFEQYRLKILESLELQPDIPRHITILEGFSTGRLLYFALDPFNTNRWSGEQALRSNAGIIWPLVISQRFSNIKRKLDGILEQELSLFGLYDEHYTVKRFFNYGDLLKEWLPHLNHGSTGSPTGVIAELLKGCSDKTPESRLTHDQKLGRIIERLLYEINEGKCSLLDTLREKPTDVEIVFPASYRKDVQAISVRIKKNERLAAKIAYRAAAADQVLYDYMLRTAEFKKQAKRYQDFKDSDNYEKRMIARRLKLYGKVQDVIGNVRKKETIEERAFRAFREIYKDILVNDYSGTKIITRDLISKLRIFKKLCPCTAVDIAAICDWEYVDGKNQPKQTAMMGYIAYEIENHYSVDRLSSLLQIKIKEIDQYHGRRIVPNIHEVTLQRAKDVCNDLIGPEGGHIRYEHEIRSTISELPDWLLQRFALHYMYIMGTLAKVDRTKPIIGSSHE
ncbi:MAG: hypothetical protein ABIG89_06355 [Candidatus Woesearchaeota archaeon]